MTQQIRRSLARALGFAMIVACGTGTKASALEFAEQGFGPELPLVRDLGVGGAMDATVQNDTLYVIGGGVLHIADITDPHAPKLLGRIANLGNSRQIEVHRGVAYVTAREDGLFIVDVSTPAVPKLLCHYDTIELATGIALSCNIAFVACRTAGVELVDISNPEQPRHLSTVRTGEAQSVAARRGVLFTGVWGRRQLVICDVRNPYQPVVISKTPLDGYGDGVAVRGRYCFVATGHHARGWRYGDDASPEYGTGHGLDIFDISDLQQPTLVSRVKTRRFYRIGMDMWDVMVAGDYAFLGDTYNGVFVLDISDIRQPRFVGHRQLAAVPRTVDGIDAGEQLPAPVGGIALAKNTLYVAGASTDLHVVDATDMARTPEMEHDESPRIPARQPDNHFASFRSYRPAGQVYGVAFHDQSAFVAAGAAGLHMVRLEPEIQAMKIIPTESFARDVAVHDDSVYVAEASGGLSIWKSDHETELECVGRYRPQHGGVAQVVAPPSGRYVLLHVGQNELQIVDVSDPRSPVRTLTEKHPGLFYTFPLTRDLMDNRFTSCLWHVSGYRWYDLYGGPKPVYSGDHLAIRSNFADGMAALGDKWLLVARGKYTLISRHETRPLDELVFHGVPGQALSGKPTIDGNTLYLSNRPLGTIQIVDISQVEQPRMISSLQLDEHPGPVVVHDGLPLIPAGYQGLLVGERVTSP